MNTSIFQWRPSKITVFAIIALSLVLSTLSYLVSKHNKGEILLFSKGMHISNFSPEAGHCYIADLGTEEFSMHEHPSSAAVYEDGVRLGPGNQEHSFIRTNGNGAYSFWHYHLYFSASDNSDPRMNNRAYEVRWPIPIPSGVAYALYAVTALALLLSAPFVIDIINKVIRSDVYLPPSLKMPAIAFAAVFAVFLVYMLIRHPVQFMQESEFYLLHAAAYVLFAFIGFDVARSARTEKGARLAAQLPKWALLSATGIYFIWRPDARVFYATLPVNLAPLIIMAASVGFVYFIRSREKGLNPTITRPVKTSFERKWGLPAATAASVLIATPFLLYPVLKNWDASGWMDSQGYDHIAHQIATGITPEGNSYYMPLYQYGMAFFYYVFGHFFFVQQIINVLMGYATVILICLTAWNIFRSGWAVLFTGVVAAFTNQLHHALFYTQIENWYIPIVALVLFTWSCYWRRARLSHLILFAVAIALAVNTRSQGAIFFAFLFLTPFFIAGLPFKKKIAHSAVMAAIVGASLVPWSIRNYVYEKRFSPSSEQSAIQMAILNDRRVGFYGIRYELGYAQVEKEYSEKYPDKNERMKAMKRDALRNIFGDPVWLAKAVYWRTLAFYGLLPYGVWAPGGPQATNWNEMLPSYIYWSFAHIYFIGFSLLGFAMSRNRTGVFLALGILGNLAVVVFAGAGEPRISYPVLPIHILLGMCAFFKPVAGPLHQDDMPLLNAIFGKGGKKYWIAGTTALILFFFAARLAVGERFKNRPIMEKSVAIASGISRNMELPSLNEYCGWLKTKTGQAPLIVAGKKVRVRYLTTNNMLPPKYAQPSDYPAFANDPKGDLYFYSYPPDGCGANGFIGVTYAGAVLNAEVREGDVVDAEGTLVLAEPENTVSFWIKAEKVYKDADPK